MSLQKSTLSTEGRSQGGNGAGIDSLTFAMFWLNTSMHSDDVILPLHHFLIFLYALSPRTAILRASLRDSGIVTKIHLIYCSTWLVALFMLLSLYLDWLWDHQKGNAPVLHLQLKWFHLFSFPCVYRLCRNMRELSYSDLDVLYQEAPKDQVNFNDNFCRDKPEETRVMQWNLIVLTCLHHLRCRLTRYINYINNSYYYVSSAATLAFQSPKKTEIL